MKNLGHKESNPKRYVLNAGDKDSLWASAALLVLMYLAIAAF